MGAHIQEQDTAVRETIRSFIEERFLYLHPEIDLKDDDPLLELGIIDSLGFVELVEEVQTQYGIEVHDADITEANFGTIAAIARYVGAAQES